MRFLKIIAVFLLSATFLGGCFSVPDFAESPEIEFAGIQSILRVDELIGGYKDSIVISVKFRDGDGDLGIESWEVDSLSKAGLPIYNFYIKQYRKFNGSYIEYIPRDTSVPLHGRFHRLSGNKPGPLEGTIHYNGLQVLHGLYPYAKDTVRFEIYIRDRAGNISNTVRTDSVILRPI